MIFYPEDIVRVKGQEKADDGAAKGTASEAAEQEEDRYAVVIRVWHNEAERTAVSDLPEDQEGLLRPLKEGEYGVEWFPSRRREITEGTSFEIVDRGWQVGDVCKTNRDINASGSTAMSGIVVSVTSHLDLRHVYTGQRLANVSTSEVQFAEHIAVGDHVVLGHWLGVVLDKYDEAVLESDYSSELKKLGSVNSATNALLQHGYLNDGDPEQRARIDVIRPEFAQSRYNPRVVGMRQLVVYVQWLAINGCLTPTEQDAHPMPKSLRKDVDQLTVVRPFANDKHTIGDQVVFQSSSQRDAHGLRISRHGASSFPCEVMNVECVHSRIDVLWQDGSATNHDSLELAPYADVDDYDVWCGDHALFRSFDGTDTAAVVQSMDAVQRTADIRLLDRTGTLIVDRENATQTVSVLELKTVGSPDYPVGVHRGDVVLLSTIPNSYVAPTVGKLLPAVDAKDPTREEIFVQLQREGDKEFIKNKTVTAATKLPKSAKDATELDWFGSVVDLLLDGSVIVELPAGKRISMSTEKLTVLDDGFDDTGDMTDDGMDEDEDEGDSEMETDSESDVPWTTEEGAEVEEEDWEDLDTGSVDEEEASTEKPAASVKIESNSKAQDDAAQSPKESKPSVEEGSPVLTFDILESAPSDHAFFSSPVTQFSKQYLARLQKEYKILRSSLPDTILVRSYEDRIDILRAIIIGSPGTPYENAPISIDFQLGPNYPNEPPSAIFLNRSDGFGRLSPNLYEEGRICLSILNTWTGEQSESWNAGKSTLLQVLVSIQGLVLVTEPYYTEPGFERQAETEQGRAASRNHSERSYVLSRRFILHAVRHPLKGFEDELHGLYQTQGRLKQVVERANIILQRGKTDQQLPADAWGQDPMSKGGKIALERMVDELEKVAGETASSQ